MSFSFFVLNYSLAHLIARPQLAESHAHQSCQHFQFSHNCITASGIHL